MFSDSKVLNILYSHFLVIFTPFLLFVLMYVENEQKTLIWILFNPWTEILFPKQADTGSQPTSWETPALGDLNVIHSEYLLPHRCFMSVVCQIWSSTNWEKCHSVWLMPDVVILHLNVPTATQTQTEMPFSCRNITSCSKKQLSYLHIGSQGFWNYSSTFGWKDMRVLTSHSFYSDFICRGGLLVPVKVEPSSVKLVIKPVIDKICIISMCVCVYLLLLVSKNFWKLLI